MPRMFGFRAAVAAAGTVALAAGWAGAQPPACLPHGPRVTVNSPPPVVVTVEGDGKGPCLRLLSNLCKKKKPHADSRDEPESFYVPIPAMVAAPRDCKPAAAACTPAGCAPDKAGCAPDKKAAADAGGDLSLAAATQDAKLALERLKVLKAQREAELASLNTVLMPTTPPAVPPPGPRVAARPGEIQDLNDKIDYLTALVDALAADLRKSDPALQLPAFDDLNRLRKPRP